MADRETLHQLVGLMPELEEDGRQGEVEPDPPRQEPCGRRAASGGLESDAQPELPRRLPAAAACPARGPESDHRDGPQAGADYLQPDALRSGVREADRRSLCRASASTAGEAVAASREGAGLRAE